MSQRKITFSFLLCFFVAVFSFLTFISSGNLDSEDGWLYASVARNIYYHHQISAAPDEYPDLNVHMNSEKGKDGVWRAPGSLGYSFSLVPAVAISDLIHRAYHVAPPQHFPLEHDWSFHLFASFTNAFYGAAFAVIFLLYTRELGFSEKSSIIISLLTLLTTSLLPLTKFSFAHMMFITFMTFCFFSIRRFGSTQQWKYLLFAALSFGCLAISYNETFTLTILPLGIYLLIYETPRQRRITLLLGFIGFVAAIGALTFLKSSFLHLILITVKVSPKILFEGAWGYLFSPGKSIFLYTPPLILIPLFWHKIRKNVRPELTAAILLTFCYLYVLGSASITKLGIQQPIWHGGMNWGARYIAPLLPLWMIIVFHIIQSLKKLQRRFIVLPLFIFGAWIQLVGVSTSYLLQYIDLPYNFFLGKTEILVYEYASFIPRYTPLLTLSKQFVKVSIDLPKTINRGSYQVRFFDGFDPPYKTSVGTFRGFRNSGYISFITSGKEAALQMDIANVPDVIEVGQSAQIALKINDVPVKQFTVKSQEVQSFQITVDPKLLKNRNVISLEATYPKKLINPQVIYIRNMKINDSPVNLGSLDYPDMSNLGVATSEIPYVYSGKIVNDEWAFWQTRARVNERTLDYWWIKNFYYWDRPTRLIWEFVLVDLLILCSSSYLAIYFLGQEKKTQ